MRVLRVYLKPAGEQWLDMPLLPGFETPNVMAALKSVGWIIDPNWMVPADMIAWAVMMELAEQKMMLLRHRFREFLNDSHRFDRTKSWALFKDYRVPEEWGGTHPKWQRVFSQGFIMRDK